MRFLSMLALVASAVLAFAGSAQAQKKKEAQAQPAAEGTPPLNACGCYQGSDGSCKCLKKSKCGCPGECEPAGCDEKRAKEQEKEAQEEIKRQQEAEKKRNAELEKKRVEMEKKEAEGGKRLRGGKPVEAESPPK